MHKGTRETKQYYDQGGWSVKDGQTVESKLFGFKEDGPIRRELHRIHIQRIRDALLRTGTLLNLLECGCGGHPESSLFDLCKSYTGIDFSNAGVTLADKKLKLAGIPYNLLTGDICKLPFSDASFDAIYSAHVLYHIADPKSQKAALQEIVRVLKPGGTAVLVVVNPRPAIFPVRLLKRLIADTPIVGPLANKLRPKPPIPFKPMPLKWIKKQLNKQGDVKFTTGGLAWVTFNQHVTEHKGIGRWTWQTIKWLDTKHPKLSAYLGNYAQVFITKYV